MKRSQTNHLNVSTSQHDLLAKPYGFCCDIKNQDSKLLSSKDESVSFFPSSDPNVGGPDIKFRIQEHDDILPFIQRSIQRNTQRTGLRSGQRSGLRSKYRDIHQINWSDQSYGRRRRRDIIYRGITDADKQDRSIKPLGELMICKRCRGPLQWYLEEEIAAAHEIMMIRRQEMHNAEMEKNIKIAKIKGTQYNLIVQINFYSIRV
ncbi:PREDICTED: uncharacterized protein LOC108552006 [Eufriesea mexicana]|uniref:uncharacterized protein LOC108552006 n=1 Tax=Eufriesea mexicana TaxID=516756 RepID=UPI00083C39AD|nr:PREDICTED: uncharacterized protein LOC108552006 [Eufriesea mexicana]